MAEGVVRTIWDRSVEEKERVGKADSGGNKMTLVPVLERTLLLQVKAHNNQLGHNPEQAGPWNNGGNRKDMFLSFCQEA